MCISPIILKNPYKGSGQVGVNYLHDTTSHYIEVPCGHCRACCAMRQSFYLQRVQMESLRSHLYMFTLTYNNESLVYTDVGDYNIAYPVLADIQKMFHRMRKTHNLEFRVSYVSEYGSKRHRPHFHGILAVDKSQGDYRRIEKRFHDIMFYEWRRNDAPPVWSPKKNKFIANRRSPLWRPLFTPQYKRGRCCTFDFHYIEPVMDHDNDVSFYVSKYITKYDSWIRSLLSKIALDESLDPEESVYLIDLLKPRCVTSKDFGSMDFPLISQYINKCASRESAFRYPQYYDIYTGKQMPMSPYYGKKLDNFKHLYNRFLKSDLFEENSTYFIQPSTSLDQVITREHEFRDMDDFHDKLCILESRLLDL